MNLIAQAGRFHDGALALACEEIEDSGFIGREDTRQVQSLLSNDRSDGLSISLVGLARVAGATPALSGPTRIDVEDQLADRDQLLSEAASMQLLLPSVAGRKGLTDLSWVETTGSYQVKPLSKGSVTPACSVGVYREVIVLAQPSLRFEQQPPGRPR